MSDYNKINISTIQAEELLRKYYRIEGKATKVVGDQDFNFHVVDNQKKHYILKIGRPDIDLNYLDFHHSILQFLKNNETVISPEFILNSNNEYHSTFIDENGFERKLRLITWIEGRLWSQVNPITEELLFSLGKKCGLLTKALENFVHPTLISRYLLSGSFFLFIADFVTLMINRIATSTYKQLISSSVKETSA